MSLKLTGWCTYRLAKKTDVTVVTLSPKARKQPNSIDQENQLECYDLVPASPPTWLSCKSRRNRADRADLTIAQISYPACLRSGMKPWHFRWILLSPREPTILDLVALIKSEHLGVAGTECCGLWRVKPTSRRESFGPNCSPILIELCHFVSSLAAEIFNKIY